MDNWKKQSEQYEQREELVVWHPVLDCLAKFQQPIYKGVYVGQTRRSRCGKPNSSVKQEVHLYVIIIMCFLHLAFPN